MALYKKIYFVSKDNMDGKVLTPRVPKNFLTDMAMKMLQLKEFVLALPLMDA